MQEPCTPCHSAPGVAKSPKPISTPFPTQQSQDWHRAMARPTAPSPELRSQGFSILVPTSPLLLGCPLCPDLRAPMLDPAQMRLGRKGKTYSKGKPRERCVCVLSGQSENSPGGRDKLGIGH